MTAEGPGLETITTSISPGISVTFLMGGKIVSLWRRCETAHTLAAAPIIQVKGK
jgi:hypothetical protein